MTAGAAICFWSLSIINIGILFLAIGFDGEVAGIIGTILGSVVTIGAYIGASIERNIPFRAINCLLVVLMFILSAAHPDRGTSYGDPVAERNKAALDALQYVADQKKEACKYGASSHWQC